MNNIAQAKKGFGTSIVQLQDPAVNTNSYFNALLITTFGKKHLFDLTISQNTADSNNRAENYVKFGLAFIFEGNLINEELRSLAATQLVSTPDPAIFFRLGASKIHKVIPIFGSDAKHFVFDPYIESTENDKPFGICHLTFFNTGDFYLNPTGGRSSISWNGEILSESTDRNFRLDTR